jgi:hypothetical protein
MRLEIGGHLIRGFRTRHSAATIRAVPALLQQDGSRPAPAGHLQRVEGAGAAII